jgi:hypothetical protein
MTLTNIRFPEENPFYLIKVRHILSWSFLLIIGILFQLEIISSTSQLKLYSTEPLVSEIALTYVASLILALLWRQCKLAGIEIKHLIGKVPDRYQWLPLVGLAIAHLFFSRGAFCIFYYPLSFIVPSFVEQILIDNQKMSIVSEGSTTFFPIAYYLIVAINICVIDPIVSAVIFMAIILHRWGAKWGNIPAIIAVCMLLVAFDYPNFISLILGILISAILYAKTRSLVVVIIFIALTDSSSKIWDLLGTVLGGNQAGSTLDVFRSQVQLGVLLFVVSAPWVIGFIYKNWSVLKGPLPYFANAAEAEKIKADSAT